MMTFSLAEIAGLLNLPIPAKNPTFHGLSRDTRTLKTGELYVAIRGEKLNGHDYVDEAFRKGASAALVDQAVSSPIPQLVVEDTVKALGKISEHWRKRFSLPLIAVTGSNGKTTLKNMIASI